MRTKSSHCDTRYRQAKSVLYRRSLASKGNGIGWQGWQSEKLLQAHGLIAVTVKQQAERHRVLLQPLTELLQALQPSLRFFQGQWVCWRQPKGHLHRIPTE